MSKYHKIIPKIWGYGIAFLGLALIMISSYLSCYYNVFLVEQMLTSIGGSLFCLGMVTCLIDLKDWKNYFSERVQDIILKHSYITCLDEQELAELQTKIYQARFKNANFNHRGSFYCYYREMIEPLISNPYRDNVKQELIISVIDENTIKVIDKVSFACRANGNNQIPQVKFAYSEKENAEIQSHDVFIKYPIGNCNAGNTEKIESIDFIDDKTGEHYKVFDLENKMQDGLIIIKESIHHMKVYEFQTWEMAHITRNFTFIAKFPCDYILQIKPFVLCPELGRKTVAPGYFNYEYESWMLPRNGIAWKLNKITDEEKISKACFNGSKPKITSPMIE